MSRVFLAAGALLLGAATLATPAHAYWRGGVWIGVGGAPFYYAPPPVYVAAAGLLRAAAGGLRAAAGLQCGAAAAGQLHAGAAGERHRRRAVRLDVLRRGLYLCGRGPGRLDLLVPRARRAVLRHDPLKNLSPL